LGECFFWCRLTQVAQTKGCKTVVVVVVVVVVVIADAVLW